MTRKINFAPGEFYHVYNRGTDKRNIFLSTSDYSRFLVLLYICNSDEPVDLKFQGSTIEKIKNLNKKNKLVNICAYCLMPNHFHILLEELEDGGRGISKFMQKLTTAYTMYFNKKNDRTGSLFQGRFKAIHSFDDSYLSYLISYIHLNPLKIVDPLWKENGVKDSKKSNEFLKQYRYSSYPDYLGVKRLEGVILNGENFPDYLETPKDFESNMNEWINYNTSLNLQG